MGETENPVNSGVSEPTEGETTPEEGDVKEENPADNDTPVIETPEKEPSTDPVEEPTEKEGLEPEVPTESEESEIENTVDQLETNDDSAPVERTVTITGWEDTGTTESPVPGLNKKVTVTTSADEGEAAFDDAKGTIKIQDGKELTLNVVAKAGYKLNSVAIGAGETVRNGSNYSAKITSDMNVTIDVDDLTYSLKFTTAEAGVKLKLDDTVKADSDKAELATAETAAIKRGAEPKDLVFTITGLGDNGVAAGKKLHVSVKADGSTVADEIDVTGAKGTDNKVTYSCKIDKADIAALRTGLEVIVEVEAGTAVAAKAHVDDEDNNDMVDIKFWSEKDTDTSTATPGWVADDTTGLKAIKTALAGETFRFQVKMKEAAAATYAIDKVEAIYNTDKKATVTAKGSDDEYNFVMPAGVDASGVSIVVTTKVDETKTRALTFKLTGDEGSATATITKIEVTKGTGNAAVKTLYTGAEDVANTSKAITGFPGIEDVEEEIKADGGLKLVKACTDGAVTGFEVKVEVKNANYELKKAGAEAANVTTRTLTYGTVAGTTGIALADTLEIAAETEAKNVAAAAGSFKFAKDAATVDNFDGDFTIEGAEAIPDDANGAYQVKANTKLVTLTVKTREGFEITKEDITSEHLTAAAIKSVTSKAPADGKVEWKIELLANELSVLTNAEVITIAAYAKTVDVAINPQKNGSETLTGFSPCVLYGNDDVTNAEDRTGLAYGGKLVATISPNRGVRLSKVSYKMGEAVTEVELEPEYVGSSVDIAKIEIAKVTDNVVITVETEKDYELTALREVNDSDPENVILGRVDRDEYDIYQVSPSGVYAVGLNQGGAAVDLVAEKVTAVVKNASGATVNMPRVVFTVYGRKYLKINLAGKNLSGQEITIDMMKDGAAVGTYRLQVAKEATYVRLKEGNKIRQDVDSVQTYTVETDGELSDISVTTASAGTGTFQAKVTPAYDNGNLTITLKPMASDDVVTIKPGADGAEATKTYKNVTFTLNAAGTSNVHQVITLEAEPVFDKTKKPTVTAVTSGASDTSFYVDVDMESADPANGRLYYEVTATAKAKDGDSADAKTFEAVAGSKLEKTLTLPLNEDVRSWGGKRRIKIDVARDGVDLGNGVGWDYDVKARLVYKNNGVVVDTTDFSEAAAAGTVDTYFASALKLVKNSKKKPVSTVYTGQEFDTPQYIATPTFTDKKVNYKVTDEIQVDGSSDSADWAFNVWIDDNGDLVMGNFDEVDEYYGRDFAVRTGKSRVGKHTITVIATADMTGQDNTDMSGAKHTMYATRASITVTVARGIESINFQNFGSKLYKAAGKPATLNVANSNIYFNGDTSGKNQPPKSKKVTYQVVGADSYGWGDVDNMTLVAAPAGITMKGSKVTVDKNFTIDPVKTHNNQFKILAQAADYKGNTTAQLSDIFTVTSDPINLDNLVLAKAQHNEDDDVVGYKVLAVQTDNKARNTVSAAEANGAEIFVLGKPATVDTTYTLAKWRRLAPEPARNFTYKGGKKNVWGVYSDGEIWANAGGVKADITVTANDGKKASRKLLLDLGWTETDGKDLALKISTTDSRYDDYDYDNYNVTVYTPNKVQPDKDIESKVTGTPKYLVEVMQGAKNDGTSTSFPTPVTYVNYDLKVTGGKLVAKYNGRAYVLATAEKTVITLTDKNVAKGQKAKGYKYTILNKGFDKTLSKMSVKVTSKPNNLWNYAKTSEQKLDLSLMNGKDPVAKGKIAKIEVDWSARTDKNWYMYRNFNDMIDSGAGAFFTVGDGGKTTLTFRSDYMDEDGVDWTSLYVNSYKLKVTVGTGTGSSFKPESQAASLTVKVTKNKKFTFKPTTSYTFNPVDGAIALTGKASVGKGEITNLWFENLQNANVDGKSNKFTRLFYIDTDEKTNMQYLKLNTNSVDIMKLMYDVKEASASKPDAELTAADFDTSKAARVPDLTKIDKKNLTGYISYWAEADKGWYDGYTEGTVKITIKIAKLPAEGKTAKASQKYTPEAAQIKSGKAGETTPINVYINGVYVNVGLAMIDPGKKDAGNLIVEGDGVNEEGQIVVKAKTVLENDKKYDANLLVVPKNSIYYATVKAAALASAAAKTNAEDTTPTTPAAPTVTRADLMKLYGIPVKVTVVGTEKPVYAEVPINEGGGNDERSKTTEQELDIAIKRCVSKAAKPSGIERVQYDSSNNKFTVTLNSNTLANNVGDAFEAWEENGYGEQLKNQMITEAERLFEDDEWNKLVSVRLHVTVPFNGKTYTREKTIKKESDNIEAFANSLYEEMMSKQEEYIAKMEMKLQNYGGFTYDVLKNNFKGEAVVNATATYTDGTTFTTSYTVVLDD